MTDDHAHDQITPEATYLNRRTFLAAGLAAATAGATAYIYHRLNPPASQGAESVALPGLIPSTSEPATQALASAFYTNEPKTSYQDITHYNNYYEFTTDKQGVAGAAADFTTAGWKVDVGGLCAKPKTFDIDDLLKISPPEERVYRMRCVEAWSMVIPWDGFSLSKLLAKVQPNSAAKFVAFQTLLDPKRMPNQNTNQLPWPYVEGLRMDEGMHPLTLLASGIYGKTLPPQDGSPLRLVIPWKYGFKGIKAIVKITLVDKQPPTTWQNAYSAAYGFYANVNPNVPHPNWSQATENRIGVGRRDTLMFNGYGEQVASLYKGMDLTTNY